MQAKLLCHILGCTNKAIFGDENRKRKASYVGPTLCLAHFAENPKPNFTLKKPLCKMPACDQQATHGLPLKKPEVCLAHADSTTHVKFTKQMSAICVFEDCGKQKSYAEEKCRCIYYCSAHKTDTAICISPMCKCGKRASMSHPGETKRTMCKTCAENSKENFERRSNMCITCKGSYQVFNFDGFPPRYCIECKEEGMTCQVNIKCPCGKTASKNLPGEPPMFCADCADDTMVDVRHHKCNEEGCTFFARYGFEGQSATHCGTHRKPGMINKAAAACRCGGLALYNLPGLLPEFCANCRGAIMVDVVHERCSMCDITRVDARNSDVCHSCHPKAFPGEPLARMFKFKENSVKAYLQAKMPLGTELIWDRQVAGTRLRPDTYLGQHH